MQNVGAGIGRISACYDRGAGSLPTWYTCRTKFEKGAASLVGQVIPIYVATLDSTNPDGNVSQSGASADYSPSPFLTGNNRFVHNTYCVPNLTGVFWTWGADKTWAQWQAVPADATGSLFLNKNCPRSALRAPTNLRLLETPK